MDKSNMRDLLLDLKHCNRDYITKPELTSRIEQVLVLHGPPTESEAKYADLCLACGELWPCSTLRILDGEEG